jgi:type II secretory pathway pseudopilin PulG
MRKKGFSLVEVVLVVLMVGFIILLISNLPSSVKLIGDSKSSSLAREIANHKMEDVRNLGYDSIANGTSPIADPRLSKLPSGSGEVIIEDCPATICKNGELIKQVSVDVSWTEAGKSRDVKITTLISKGGLR